MRYQLTPVRISSVQLLSCVRLFATPGTAARQASLSITNSRSPPKPMSIMLVMPVRMAIIKSLHIINIREDEPSYTTSGNVNWCNPYGKQYGVS